MEIEAVIHCEYDELKPVEEFVPYPKNRNKHSKEQIERLALLLRAHGIRSPIVVAKDQQCIAKGHGTLEAIKLNGWGHAPVVYQCFESQDALYAYVQSDNAIASWSILDLSEIHKDLAEPDLGPFDINLLGIENFQFEPNPKSKEKTCPHCGLALK